MNRFAKHGLAQARVGMTFLEIIASLLVLTVGMSAVIGLTMYGLRQAGQVQAQGTALATAVTMFHDPAPIGWSLVASTGGVEEGWLNGYFVRRRRDGIEAVPGDLQSVAIQVDVYTDHGGTDTRPVASMGGRILEQP